MPPLNAKLSDSYMNLVNNNYENKTVKEEEDVKKSSDEVDYYKEFKYFHVKTPVKDNKLIRYIYINEEKYGLVWPNIFMFVILHFYYFYGLYKVITEREIIRSWIFHFFYTHLAGLGVTVGAHRLWAHRAFEASLPLRIILCIFFTIAGQNDIITWARDHRVHHKFTETDADPHNSKRGMFFAHLGWLLTKKHPDVLIKGKGVSLDDLKNDKVVQFNRKYYIPLYLFFRILLPFFLPIILWNETVSFSLNGLFCSYIGLLHSVWFVNSAAHLFGDRPYNKKIQPRNNFFVNIVAMGEGFHNYHHAFPFDYAIDEHGSKINLGKHFIDFFSKIGLAYKLRRASPEIIKKTKLRVLGENEKEDDHYLNPHPY